jgi:hypothetical protein
MTEVQKNITDDVKEKVKKVKKVKKIKPESTHVFRKPVEIMTKHYVDNIDSIRISQKKYFDANKERLLKAKRDAYNNNPEQKARHTALLVAYRLKKKNEKQLKQLHDLAIQFNQQLVPLS